jgi:putative hydrolase of HD superfamily
MRAERLKEQLAFLVEIDKLKGIVRRTHLLETPRLENSAEHSWHIAMMALLLREHAEEEINLLQVLKMLLIHDIVEIDAGDTFCYDQEGAMDKERREIDAAVRLFGLLPSDQGNELRALWDEFEAQETAEAKFAGAMDRLMPLLHNYHSQGKGWREHAITRSQVVERNKHIQAGSAELWQYASEIIEKSVEKGYLAP